MTRKQNKQAITRSRALYITLDIIVHLLSLVGLAVLVLSMMLTYSLVGMSVEYYFQIEIFEWLAIGMVTLGFSLMFCALGKDYLKRRKTITTYVVKRFDANDKELAEEQFDDLQLAVIHAETQAAFKIMIIRHCSNKYTKLDTNKLLITCEYDNEMKKLKMKFFEDKPEEAKRRRKAHEIQS